MRICQQCGRPGFKPWVGKIPWRRECLPTPVFLLGELHRQRNLAATVHRVTKESDTMKGLTLEWVLNTWYLVNTCTWVESWFNFLLVYACWTWLNHVATCFSCFLFVIAFCFWLCRAVLPPKGFPVGALGFSCPEACGILVPYPGTEPTSPESHPLAPQGSPSGRLQIAASWPRLTQEGLGMNTVVTRPHPLCGDGGTGKEGVVLPVLITSPRGTSTAILKTPR